MRTYVKKFPDNTAYVVNAKSKHEAMLIIDSVGDPTDNANAPSSIIEIKNVPWMIEILPDQTLSHYDEYLPIELEQSDE
jgi:hypothetical protein